MAYINKNVTNNKNRNKTKSPRAKIQDALQFAALLRSRTAILIYKIANIVRAL